MLQAEELAQTLSALKRHAYALVGDPQEAEDVLQDVFVRALGALPAFRAGAPLGPWLRRILENRCIDALRRRDRERPSALDEETVAPPDTSADPAAIVEQQERVKRVFAAVQRLPKSYRRTLLLHDFAGHDAHEIARLNSLPYNTIRTHVRRARQRVRTMLGDTAA